MRTLIQVKLQTLADGKYKDVQTKGEERKEAASIHEENQRKWQTAKQVTQQQRGWNCLLK